MPLRIVLMGGPGAGKGTQAVRIAERENIPHISTGDIFRGHMRDETEIGEQIRDYMNEGRLVPDELTVKMVSERLSQDDCSAGYVLDGFPRTLKQAEFLDKTLNERGEQVDVVVELRVDDAEIVRRLTARRNCPDCGRIYNAVFNPPKTADMCDDCDGVALAQRDDDKEETIRERLRVYHTETEPIVSYYDRADALRVLDAGSGSADAIAEKVEEILAAAAGAQ